MPSAPPATEVTQSAAAGRRLTLLYVLALSSVALLSIGGQWLVQWQLSNGESDSRVVNVAGRQRMLSQRLAKAALRMQVDDDALRHTARAELDETLDDWATSHRGLQRGSEDLRLPGGNSAEVAQLFASIEPHFAAMREAAERLTRADHGASHTSLVATIQAHEGDFLAGMDMIVNQYVDEAEAKVDRLRRLESAILALTLAVLLLEGLLVFRPAVRRIDRVVARLARVSESLRDAKDEAEQANAAKTRFLANVSHELRTPMAAVLGMTELARSAADNDERERYLSIVDEAGETLLALLNDLIDLARIDSGELELESVVFDPYEPVRRVARLMQATATDKKIVLRVQDAAALPEAVCGDRRRVEQVLLNFVSNAIKSTDTGEVTIGCRQIKATAETVSLRYTVTDTGVGIARDDQQRIFEPFAQLEDRQANAGGAGLGLAICRRIADSIGALIAIVSEPDVGTSISITVFFPIATPIPEAACPNTAGGGAASLRVLVVEDTEANQLLLREYLTRAGHDAMVASNAEDAIRIAREVPPDVALIDLHLPDADGIAVATRLGTLAESTGRRPPKTLCVTAAAAALSDAEVSRVFDGVLTKPIKSADLIHAIHGVVGGVSNVSSHGESIEAELAAAFLSIAPRQIDELAAAVNERRLDDCRVLAHRFAGQVGYFDAPELRRDLRRLEDACVAGDRAAADAIGPVAFEALTRLTRSLRLAASTGDVPGLARD